MIKREFIYLWYYFSVQLEQIFGYWVLGIVMGSVVSVFSKDKILSAFFRISEKKPGLTGLALTSLLGILLSALFQCYVPADTFGNLFQEQKGFGILMAATIGVPLYACGGGTIPLLQQWMASGMSLGAAAAFMITGPATKITNLGALKIVLGLPRFILYFAYIILFSFLMGMLIECFKKIHNITTFSVRKKIAN